MRRRVAVLIGTMALLCAAALPATAPAAAAKTPAWWLSVNPMPANFNPSEVSEYLIVATNVGAAATSGTSTIEADLPAGLKPLKAVGITSDTHAAAPPACTIALPGSVECKTSEAVGSGRLIRAQVTVEVEVPPAPAEGTLTSTFAVKGGGADADATRAVTTAIGPKLVPFSILPGFGSPLTEEDGSAATLAGSHPYQLTVDLAFPTEHAGSILVGTGHPRDIRVDLPRGLLGDPAASHVLCSELQLTSEACPDESQIGVIDVTTLLSAGAPAVFTSNLYNMVPPPGSAAALATNVAGVGLFVHLLGSVRSDGDYGVTTEGNDVLAIANPIFAARSQIWGDPSSAVHDQLRGECQFTTNSCDVPSRETAFLTLPGDCPGEHTFKVRADSWEEPGLFKEAEYEGADLEGNPVSTTGCERTRIRTDDRSQADDQPHRQPLGPRLHLHQPQNFNLEGGEGRATAELKDTTSPSRRASASIPPRPTAWMPAPRPRSATHRAGKRSTSPSSRRAAPTPPSSAPWKSPRRCWSSEMPNTKSQERPRNRRPAARTAARLRLPRQALRQPLRLARSDLPRRSKTPRPASSPSSPARSSPIPQPARSPPRFEENPQLPLEDVHAAHSSAAPAAPLITPPACATYTTTPTSPPGARPKAPTPIHSRVLPDRPPRRAGAPARPARPRCRTPRRSRAGTLCPQAGAYSPSSSSSPAKTAPSASPASTPPCPRASRQARRDRRVLRGRRSPRQRRAKAPTKAPSSSRAQLPGRLGSRHASTSAPAPARPPSTPRATPTSPAPTKAPRSRCVVDLPGGRRALRPRHRRRPRRPLRRSRNRPDPRRLRSAADDHRRHPARPALGRVEARPARSFTLNPTTCDQMAITGGATSVLGAVAPLSERFQVGGCKSLALQAQALAPASRARSSAAPTRA